MPARASRFLLRGLDLMLLALVVVAVVQAPPGRRVWAVLTAAVLVSAYGLCRRGLRIEHRDLAARRGAWWPDTAAVAAPVAVWLVLLVLSPGALWIAFALVLFQLHALGPRRAAPLVVLTTGAAVVAGLARRTPDDPVIGYLLGPVLGAVVATGFVLGLEALVRESQARQRALDELETARAHLATAERARAVAAERERLAREIHDTLAQGLSAIELLLRAAGDSIGRDDERAAGLVGQARTAARDNLAEARRFVYALSPADLDQSSLPDALARVADRVQQSGTAVRVRTEGRQRPLAVSVETALLRVAQSALANVEQHARAGHADVVLSFGPDRVRLEIGDDGVGFDPGPGGFGLRAMRSRVTELGGSVEVDTAPGRGTRVAVTLPALERGAEETQQS